MEENGIPLETTSATLRGRALQCPKCPVVTDTLTRHLRLVHSIKDAPRCVKKKGKCHLCFKEVSQFSPHLKGYHKISPRSALYNHLLQLARYGFNEAAQSSDEICSDSDGGELEDERLLLERFKAHLESIDGGLRSEDTAVQHTRQIRQIISEHGLEVFQDIGPLMEKGGYLHKNWKEPEVTGRRAWRVGTVKSYLYSIRLLLNFFLLNKEFISEEQCNTGLRRITCWIASLHKESKVRRQDLHLEEVSKLLTADEISAFYRCVSHRQALSVLQNLSKTRDAIDIDYATVSTLRNDLILWLLFENGQRSGAVLNSTVDEYLSATLEANNEWLMCVKEHKTYACYGPCYLVLSQDLYDCLNTWVHVIRPVLLEKVPFDERKPNIFLNYNGKALDKTNSMRQLKGYVEEALGVSGVTATRIRKSLAVLLTEANGSSMHDVASHFSHSQGTLKRHYNIKGRMHTSLKVSSKIKEMTQTVVSIDPSTEEVAQHMANPMESKCVATTSKYNIDPYMDCCLESDTLQSTPFEVPDTLQHTAEIEDKITEENFVGEITTLPAESSIGAADEAAMVYNIREVTQQGQQTYAAADNDAPSSPVENHLMQCPVSAFSTGTLEPTTDHPINEVAQVQETTALEDVSSLSSPMGGNEPSQNPIDAQSVRERRLWNPDTTKLLLGALEEYLRRCLKTGHLPKVAEVTQILIRNNLKCIMDDNGRQRTMEKVRLELKNIKKQMITAAATT